MQNEIKQPQISKETMEEMAKFFAKTSIPRILEDRKNKEKQKTTA